MKLLLAVVLLLALPVAAGAYVAPGATIVSASLELREQGDEASGAPDISADGRFVVFETRARNLFGPEFSDPAGAHYEGGVMRREIATGRLELVAPGDLVGDDASVRMRGARSPSVSADGRYVAFSTAERLVPSDVNGNIDVYVRDMVSGTYELVSARDGSAAGASYATRDPDTPLRNPGADVSPGVAISADGDRVLFRTVDIASDLPDRGSPVTPPYQLFVRVRSTQRTLLVTQRAGSSPPEPVGGANVGGALSADGTTVAWPGQYAEQQTRFVDGEFADSSAYYYLWRRIEDGPAAPTRRITGAAEPEVPGCTTFDPRPDIVNGCTGPLSDREQAATGITSTLPALSADGLRVAFTTGAAPRPSVLGAALDLWVTDMTPGRSRTAASVELTREGTNRDPADTASISTVALSPDGRWAAITTARTRFLLPALRLVDPPTTVPGLEELYLIDLATGNIQRGMRGASGGNADAGVAPALSISDGGRRIAFASSADNLFFGDANQRSDVFVIDRLDAPPPTPDEPEPPLEPAAEPFDTPPPPTLKLRVTVRKAPGGKVRLQVRAPRKGKFSVAIRGRVPDSDGRLRGPARLLGLGLEVRQEGEHDHARDQARQALRVGRSPREEARRPRDRHLQAGFRRFPHGCDIRPFCGSTAPQVNEMSMTRSKSVNASPRRTGSRESCGSFPRSRRARFVHKESSQVMSSFALSSRRRRLALSVGGALAAALLASPAAHAQFTLAECQGGAAPGQGATFQNAAFGGFKGVFGQEAPTGCGTAVAAGVSYFGSGSGAGRIALGQVDSTNPRSLRAAGYRWAGADEAPNPAQRLSMEKGPTDANNVDVTTADDNPLHVIPVAIGAIAMIVHLPDGCTDFGSATLDRQRPQVTLQNFENVWYGAGTTWGALIPGLTTLNCGDQPIERVVRRDSSGSTFALKQLLANINPSHAAEWRNLTNQQWPTDGTAVRPGADGGGALASYVALAANDGTIGYIDLATARSNTSSTFTYVDSTFDKTFWLPMQRALGSSVYDDPQLNLDGYKNGNAARGANCAGVQPQNPPATPASDPTLGNWSVTDSTLTGSGYSACTLTYDMAFDDNAVAYCNSPEEQAKARTIKDYFAKGILSTAGQATLAGNDYAALPGQIFAIAKAGVEAIGWNKGGKGRLCDGAPPVATPTPTPTPAPGGNPPAPAPVSNAVTLASSRVSGTTIRLSLQLPGAGKISIASSTKPKKGKAIKLTTKNVTVTKSGAQTITVSLSSKAKSALKKDKKLKVTLKITYTPTGGTAKTITKSVTVKQAKKKTKS